MTNEERKMFKKLERRIEISTDPEELLDIINLMRKITGDPPAIMSEDFINHCIGVYENSKIERNQ